MRCAWFGLLLSVLISALAACAQPADTPVAPAGECDASQTVCESVVMTPPIRSELPDLPPSAPQTSDGLRFRARLFFSNTSLGDEPTTLRATVTVENLTTEAAFLNMDACHLRLLAYDLPGRPGNTQDVRATYEDTCYFEPDALVPQPDGTYALKLEPGVTQLLWMDLNDYFLSSKLSDGRYGFDLKLVLSEHTLTFAVGSSDVRFFIPNLGYRAVTESVGNGDAKELRAAVTVENYNDEPVLLTYGHCALLVRFYRTADRAGEPFYSRVATPDGLCLAYLASSGVRPGGSLLADEFKVSIPLGKIEEEVESGYYYVQLSLELDWREMKIPAGVLYVAP